MAKFIVIQSGHQGVTSGQTGAPGEQELNVRIRDRVSQILISKGFMLQLVNANPSDAEINKDFDLFLALHGDAAIYGTGGGCISAPDPNYDSVNTESKRIAKCIEDNYFNHSGIVNHPERINVNMTRYYMWNELTKNTPCVILEMGVVQDAHDKVILADTDRVANSIARGVCVAFGVPFDAPVPPTPQPTPIPVPPPATNPNPPAPPVSTPTTSYNDLLKKLAEINKIASGSFWFYKSTFLKIKNLSA